MLGENEDHQERSIIENIIKNTPYHENTATKNTQSKIATRTTINTPDNRKNQNQNHIQIQQQDTRTGNTASATKKTPQPKPKLPRKYRPNTVLVMTNTPLPTTQSEPPRTPLLKTQPEPPRTHYNR